MTLEQEFDAQETAALQGAFVSRAMRRNPTERIEQERLINQSLKRTQEKQKPDKKVEDISTDVTLLKTAFTAHVVSANLLGRRRALLDRRRAIPIGRRERPFIQEVGVQVVGKVRRAARAPFARLGGGRIAALLGAATPAAAAASVVVGVGATVLAATTASIIERNFIRRERAIEARKRARGVLDIPAAPTIGQLVSSAIVDSPDEFDNKLWLSAIYAKRWVQGSSSGVWTFLTTLITSRDLNRSMQNSRQEFWRHQLQPHSDVKFNIDIEKNRWERQFRVGGNVYGGWKEYGTIGG